MLQYTGPPNNWTLDEVEKNVLAVCTGNILRKNFLDFDSIMLYAFPKDTLVSGSENKNNYRLSKVDKASMQRRYPGRVEEFPPGLEVYAGDQLIIICDDAVDRHIAGKRAHYPRSKTTRRDVIRQTLSYYSLRLGEGTSPRSVDDFTHGDTLRENSRYSPRFETAHSCLVTAKTLAEIVLYTQES